MADCNGCYNLPRHPKPAGEFLIGKENIADPKAPQPLRFGLQADILDAGPHRQKVCEVVDPLLRQQAVVQLVPIWVGNKDENRRVFYNIRRMFRAGQMAGTARQQGVARLFPRDALPHRLDCLVLGLVRQD